MTETLVAVSPPSPKKSQDPGDPGGPPPGEAFGPIPDAGPERELTPAELGATASIGHFGLFHASWSGTFWTNALGWLRDGRNPWPEAVVHATPPCRCDTEASR